MLRIDSWRRLRDHLRALGSVDDVDDDCVRVALNDVTVSVRRQSLPGATWVKLTRELGPLHGVRPEAALADSAKLPVGLLCVIDGVVAVAQMLPLSGLRTADLDATVRALAGYPTIRGPDPVDAGDHLRSVALWARTQPQRIPRGGAGRCALRVIERVFGRGEHAVADELFAPAHAAQVRELATMIRNAFPDYELRVGTLIVDEPQAACQWTAAGTHTGEFLGVPPTGAYVAWTGTALFAVDGDTVVAMTFDWDRYGLLQQLRAALRR